MRRRPSVALTAPGRFLAEHVTRAGVLLDQADRGVRALVEAEGGHPAPRRLRHTGDLSRSRRRAGARQPTTVRGDRLPSRHVRRDADGAARPRDRHRRGRRTRVQRGAHRRALVRRSARAHRRAGTGAGAARPCDLNGLLWVHREEGSATRVALEAALHAIGVAPRRRLAMPSWEAIKLVVAHGDAVAAISRLAIRVEEAAGTLTELAVRGWRLGRPISIASHPDLPLSPIAAAFADQLRHASNQLDRSRHPRLNPGCRCGRSGAAAAAGHRGGSKPLIA